MFAAYEAERAASRNVQAVFGKLATTIILAWLLLVAVVILLGK